jgi:hypothetical protein
MAGALGVFLIETDRTLVDSHSTLLRAERPNGRGVFYVAIQSVRTRLELVYVAFRSQRTTNLGNGAPRPQFAISCLKRRRDFSSCVAAWRDSETT